MVVLNMTMIGGYDDVMMLNMLMLNMTKIDDMIVDDINTLSEN